MTARRKQTPPSLDFQIAPGLKLRDATREQLLEAAGKFNAQGERMLAKASRLRKALPLLPEDKDE
jgi:hypothetical protein